jgi:hypothetical protein
MVSSGLLRRVALVRTEVLEERSASIIRVTRIGELETTLTVTSNRRSCPDDGGVTFLQNFCSYMSHMAYISEDGILHSHLRELLYLAS